MVIIGGIASLLVAGFAVNLPFQTQTIAQAPTGQEEVAAVRRIVATMQLASQEYRLGVVDGKVVLAPEVEEAHLFLQEARRSAGTLPAGINDSATVRLDSLITIVIGTGQPDSLDAGARRLATVLATRFGIPLDETPATPPSLVRGTEIYRAQCASCHGSTGAGDGPLAATLDPKPADLTDTAAMANQSLLDLYRRITIGVVGTAMPSFEAGLSADDRWSVALYASTLHQTSAAPVFARVRTQLDSALAMARLGNTDAGPRVLDAYMTFEQIERTVRAKHPELAAEVEAAFTAFRQAASRGSEAHIAELGASHEQLSALLVRAELVVNDRMSPTNLFVQSFVILLREGLEAILIVGALLTFLVKMGAGDRRRDVHFGIGAAVAASLITAILLETIFHLTPAKQEALEGATMLAATVVLFYVSYWLLSKMEVAKWNHFVKSRVHEALTSGSSLALASAAFLAVYREGFETVLFYKALFLAAGDGASVTAIIAGMAVGTIVMIGVYIAINRFGIRLPLKPFFGVTSAFLYYTAFVFAGRGVAELQEGGILSTTLVEWAPRIPALGIHPTAESLAAQGVLLVLLVVALIWTFAVSSKEIPPAQKLPATT